MSRTKQVLPLAALAAIAFSAEMPGSLTYPPAPKTGQIDDYHGTRIADPYRTLEDADSPQTKSWVEQENALTFSYLAKLPGRDAVRKRLTELWDYERYGNMFTAGGRYFYSHNTGLQNQNVLYVQDSLNGVPRVLLDPNTYRKDGTAALSGESVSWNGKLLAYAVSQAGSDWSEWHVRDVATGEDLPDLIQWVKIAAVAWARGDAGFYYSRLPEPPAAEVLTAPATHSAIYFHKLGDPQSADRLIYERPDHPVWLLEPETSEDGSYLIVSVELPDAGKNLVFYQDLREAAPRMVELITKERFKYDVVGTVGSRFYVVTTDGAPRGRVMAIDVEHPEPSNWKEIVPEREATLGGARMADGKLLLDYLEDAHAAARTVTLEGKAIREIELPGLGTASFSRTRQSDKELFYSYTSYTSPPAIYRLDLESGASALVHRSPVKFDAAAFETKQVFYRSKDGTRVPMFLTYKKGLRRDGKNPTLLYGYGGFNVAVTPAFGVPYVEWMERGGVFAVANLRGGSEYGEEWHRAGTKQNKQNVFDDFIAAAEWLIREKYTSTPKLAIFGGSNGGLLVGAVLNQRPDLFGAAMPAVGVMDMLRYQKFGFGATWAGDYGTSDDAAEFKALIQYSPLHNIHAGAHYPPVLITTSDHDDRVMPGHSLKYAATLQAAQGGPAPILIRIETRAGHGAGKPTAKSIDEWADRFAFLERALAM